MKALLLTLIPTLAMPAAGALAQPPAAIGAFPETITVSGTSRLSIAPDRVTFTVGVQSVAPTVDQAVNDNNQRIAAVVAALKAAGATDKEIRTMNFSIFPQQDYSQGQLPRILGYQVSNSVTVVREKVADAGRLLQAAVNAGVNTSSGLNFIVADPTKGRAEGLKRAFDDARAKATTLAQAADRTLGRAMTISEGGESMPPPRPMPMAARAMTATEVSEIPIEGGMQELTFNVSVTFELR